MTNAMQNSSLNGVLSHNAAAVAGPSHMCVSHPTLKIEAVSDEEVTTSDGVVGGGSVHDDKVRNYGRDSTFYLTVIPFKCSANSLFSGLEIKIKAIELEVICLELHTICSKKCAPAFIHNTFSLVITKNEFSCN